MVVDQNQPNLDPENVETRPKPKNNFLLRFLLIVSIFVSFFVFFLLLTPNSTIFDLSNSEKIDKSTNTEVEKSIKVLPVCLTKECMNLAANMKSYINEEISACDDFYQHACGNYQPDHEQMTLIEENFVKETKKAFETVADFLTHNDSTRLLTSEKVLHGVYEKCLNRDDTDLDAMVEEFVEKVGFPFEKDETLNRRSKQHAEEINKILALLLTLDVNSNQFFEIETQRKTLKISPIFCRRGYQKIDLELVQKILDRISLKSINKVDNLFKNAIKSAIEVDQVGVWCSESLTETFKNREEEAIGGEDFDLEKTSLIDFDLMLKTIAGSHRKGILTEMRQKTIFVNPTKFTERNSTINSLIDFNPHGVLNYLVIRYIERFAKKDFFVNDRDCPQIVMSLMPRTTLSMYVNHFVRQENVLAVPHLVNSIKKTFLEKLSKTEWLDNSTRSEIVELVSEFTTDVGAPGTPGKEDNLLVKLNVTEEDTFYKLYTRLNLFSLRNAINYVLSDTEMSMERERVEAKANFNRQIDANVMLAPMLIDPIFDVDYPLAVQFGRAGARIGKELAHVAAPRDEKKRISQKWDPEAIEQFDERANCVLDEAYPLNEKIKYSSARRTVSELIGIQTAFSAFKKSTIDNSRDNSRLSGIDRMSSEQLFFYSTIQTKCQKKERLSFRDRSEINAIFSLVPEFSDAFQCKKSTNPPPKCRLF